MTILEIILMTVAVFVPSMVVGLGIVWVINRLSVVDDLGWVLPKAVRRTVFNVMKLADLSSLKPVKMTEKNRAMFGENLQMFKVGWDYVVTPNQKQWDNLHPHQIPLYFGIKTIGRTRWLPLVMVCGQVEGRVHHLSGGKPFSQKEIRPSMPLDALILDSLKEHVSVPATLELAASLKKIDLEHRIFGDNEDVQSISLALQRGLTPHDYHNLFFHPERFQKELKDSGLKNIPVEFAKALYNLPEKLNNKTYG